MNVVEAMQDRKLFGGWFKNSNTWLNWHACLSALFALKPKEHYEDVFRKHTGRTEWPTTPSREAWLVVGRRGGKSLIASLVAIYLACFRDYSKHLAPGEVATVMVIATDRHQARTIMRYVNGFIDHVPMLAAMTTSRTQEGIEFSNRSAIEVHSCSFRSVRGYTLAGVVCDEIAFWRSEESANPDKEVIGALRPGLATLPGSMLLCISSPYAKRGALWDAYRRHYGKDGDPVLVWNAPSVEMNPSLNPGVVAQALEEDESAARSEYLAEFRSDIEAFVDRETINSLVIPGRVGLPFVSGSKYVAFVDPSGGSADSFTLAVAHLKDDRAIIDCLLEKKPPFSPERTVQEFASILNDYRVSTVTGDRYAGEWPREQFRKYRIDYELSDRNKTELYQAMLPRINSGRVEFPDNPRLISQICGLDRRTTRSGRETIDHAPGAHDDLANAVAGVLYAATADDRNELVVVKLLGF